jgi:hypothetical protein
MARPPVDRSVLPLVVKVDHVANDVILTVYERYVLPEGHVLVVLRSGRQLASEVGRHSVGALLQLSVERLAGLDPLLLCGSEAIRGSHPFRRVVLVLVVPVLRDLAVMLVELRIVSILGQRTAGEEKQDGESCEEMGCFHVSGPSRA